MAGLFLGYLYFSIPRVILTVMAAAEKLDPQPRGGGALARRLARWRVAVDVILPALRPALIASGAICFATSMGAFGTAFTLATNIDVLPMTIYTEFTLYGQHRHGGGAQRRAGRRSPGSCLRVARTAAGATVAAAA